MKLWKILLATMIALVLVCAVAMADTCEDKCTPSSNYYVVEDATCTKAGLKVQYKCIHADCDNNDVYLNVEVIPALGHDYTESVADRVEATCTAAGEKHLYCRRNCGETGAEKIESLAKLDHDTVKSNQLSTPATCTKGGEDVYVCKDCYEVITKKTEAAGHTWSHVNGVPATCTENGHTSHQKCDVCGATNGGAVIPALGHDFSVLADSSKQKATCTTDGYKLYKCSRCTETDKVITETATGHVITRKVAEVEATCTEDGYISYACANCYEVEAVKEITEKAPGHVMTRKVAEKAATCEEGGYVSYACANCYEAKAEKVYNSEALGHNFAVLKQNIDPTCETEGKRVYSCVNTGCTETDEVKIAKIAHNYAETEWEPKVEATCVLPGTEKNHCTMCNAAWIERETKALGHQMSEEKVWKKEPNCLEDGIMVKLCEREDCNYEQTTIVAAYGHMEKENVQVDATCDKVGMMYITCERGCGILESNVIIPAKGHKGEVTNYVAPTCTAEGTKTTKCENCNKTVTETIAKLAHKYEWVTITPASPAGNGRDEYKCACGDVKEVKTVKYTKWYYNNTITSFGPTTRELVGGNDWYRVTPVDLTVDGVYTYDLIASNKYVVGKVTITVNAGALTVSYKTNYDVDVKDEALLIYASKADLATGTAVTAPVGAAINAAETFGADTKVLVSLILTGDYDAAGKGLVDASAAAGMIANID